MRFGITLPATASVRQSESWMRWKPQCIVGQNAQYRPFAGGFGRPAAPVLLGLLVLDCVPLPNKAVASHSRSARCPRCSGNSGFKTGRGMIITVTQLGPQPGHERRLKISRDFSLWVAMSAARQGITVRGRQLYPHLRKIDLSSVLNAAESITPVEFSNWHKTSVEDLARSLDLPAGWAAKLINMILKVRVYVGREGPSCFAWPTAATDRQPIG
jgi:hypothetical protein